MDIEVKYTLQHGCHSMGAHYSVYRYNLTHFVVDFDYFGSILDSICYLDIMEVSLARCMLYVDDILPCES